MLRCAAGLSGIVMKKSAARSVLVAVMDQAQRRFWADDGGIEARSLITLSADSRGKKRRPAEVALLGSGQS